MDLQTFYTVKIVASYSLSVLHPKRNKRVKVFFFFFIIPKRNFNNKNSIRKIVYPSELCKFELSVTPNVRGTYKMFGRLSFSGLFQIFGSQYCFISNMTRQF